MHSETNESGYRGIFGIDMSSPNTAYALIVFALFT